jgi:hypothetical protein
MMEEATLVTLGLKERAAFPAAWTTKTPAFVANKSSVSSTLRKAEGPDGTLDARWKGVIKRNLKKL